MSRKVILLGPLPPPFGGVTGGGPSGEPAMDFGPILVPGIGTGNGFEYIPVDATGGGGHDRTGGPVRCGVTEEASGIGRRPARIVPGWISRI